jgi:hypothetical protein
MLWVGCPFRLDTRWWASMLERPNRQYCHPHRNKIKNRRSHLLESPLFPIHSRTNSSCPHRCGLLHRDHAAASSPPRAAPRPSAVAYFPVSPPPFTTHRRVLSRRGVVHDDYSSAAFFTTPSHLPTAILPLHCTRALLAGYCSSPSC